MANDDFVPMTPAASGDFVPMSPQPAAPAAPAAPATPKTWLDKADDLVSGFGGQVLSNLNPINAISSAASAIWNPVKTAQGLVGAAENDGNARSQLLSNAADNFHKGNYGQAAFDALDGSVPILGPAIANAGQAAQNGDYSQAGKVAANIATPELARVLPSALAENYQAIKSVAPSVTGAAEGAAQSLLQKINPSDPHSLVMSALRPTQNTFQFRNSLNKAMPDIKAAESQLGKPVESLDDLIGDGQGGVGAVQLAKAANRQQFRSMFPGAQPQSDLSSVADAMTGSISKKMMLEDPAAAQKIVDTANKYRASFGLEDIGDLLQETNGELESYYGKNPAARKAAAATNPDIASKVAQAGALRTAMYNMLDAPGLGDAARQLQQRWGALNDVENAAIARRNVMLRAAPENLAQQLSKIQAATKIAGGLGKVALGSPGAGAMDIGQAIAGAKTADYLKQFNSTDGILKRAFKGYGNAPGQVNMPVRPYTGPDRQLNSGRNIFNMPGVAPETDSMGAKPLGDESGPVPFQPTRNPGYWTPQSRNKLLMPATKSIEPPPDTSGPIPFDLPRNAGYHTPVLTPKQKLLNVAGMFGNQSESLGSRYGDSTDMVPFQNPHTGEIQYLPKWMTEQLKGK